MPERDEHGNLRPHPYYYAPEYAEQRARDEANREFAAVLGEALRRMCAEHEGRASEANWWAERAERAGRRGGAWLAVAALWQRDAREQAALAQIYRWYAHMVGPYGPPGVCTCRLELAGTGGPRYCPHVPDGRYW